MARPTREDGVPDVRDGLSRVQRIVLHELARAAAELGRESVPTALLYGRVAERLDLDPGELVTVLRSLGSGAGPPAARRGEWHLPRWMPRVTRVEPREGARE